MTTMKNTIANLFIATVVSVAVLSSHTASAAAPQVNLTNAAGDMKNIQASVVIDAPPAAVWQTLTDYNNLKGFMPGYEKSHIVGGSGAVKTLDIGMKVSRLMPTFNYQARVKENKAGYSINIQRVAGDFDSFNATYKLISLQGGSKTQLVYNLAIDLGAGVPKLGADHVLKSTTEKSMSAVQAHCAAAYRKSLVANAAR